MVSKHEPNPLVDELLDRVTTRRDVLKRTAVIGLSVPAIAGLLAACGDDDDDPTPSPPVAADPSPTPAEPDDADEEPTEADQTPEPDDDDGAATSDGSVIWALNQDPVNLIPFGSTPTANMWGKEFMYDSLLAFDTDLSIEPALAESYEASGDATTYTFNLREGVPFHNDQELTSADVVYSLEMAANPPEPGVVLAFFESFETATIEAVDDLTVELTFENPDPTVLGLFAWSRHTPIVPDGILDEIDVRSEGIGTGPFRLIEYVSNDRVEYERFEDHWNEGTPKIATLTLKVLPDEQGRVAALRSGEIDGGSFSADIVRTLESDDSLEVMTGLFSAPRVIQYTIHGEEPWADVRVRQAINAATNRQTIIDNVYGGDAVVTGPIPPGYGDWFIAEEELWERWYTPDLDRARELMAEAGYEDGFEVELQSIAGPEHTPIAEILQFQLQEINIDVNVVPLEIGQFAANNASGEFQWQATGRGMRGDPSQHVVDFRPPARPEWFTAWSNDEVTQLYAEALEIADHDERHWRYIRIQEILLDEMPNMYTVQPMRYHVVRNRLKGMYVSYTEFHTGLREAWVED